MDCRQNNKKLMLRQCPLGIAQQLVYYAIAVSTTVGNSHKDNVRSSAVEKQLMQKESNFQAQLHLPTLDLFWANLLTTNSPTHTYLYNTARAAKKTLAKMNSLLSTTKWTIIVLFRPAGI